MKKVIIKRLTFLGLLLIMTSCYNYKQVIGNGSQLGVEVSDKNHYFFCGLAQAEITNPKEMAKGANNFEVKTIHAFDDILWTVFTFGVYSPTTTIVKR